MASYFYKAIKFSLEKLGKPEREFKREQYDAIHTLRHTGKYDLRNRTVLALLLTRFGKSLIYQYGLLRFVLSGFDPVPRQDSAVLAVFLLSSVMSEQPYMLEAFLFVRIQQTMMSIA